MTKWIDRQRLRLALIAFRWARRTIAAVRGKRGREFLGIGSDAEMIDRMRRVYTELDAAEDRRKVSAYDFSDKPARAFVRFDLRCTCGRDTTLRMNILDEIPPHSPDCFVSRNTEETDDD